MNYDECMSSHIKTICIVHIANCVLEINKEKNNVPS